MDIILAVGVLVLASLFFARYQEQMTYNNGLEWDGQYYAKITRDLADGQRPETAPPFVYRIGVPFVASLLGSDVIQSWRIIGILATVLTLVLLYILLTLHVEQQWVRFVLLLFFLLNFKSAVRGVWSAPVETDYFDKLFLILGLIVLHRIRKGGWTLPHALLLTVITFAGFLCREIVGALAVTALFAGNPIGCEARRFRVRFPPVMAILPLLGATAAFVLIKMIVTPLPGGGFARTAIGWLYNKSLPDYLLAWFIAFSPALILPLYDWRNTLKYLLANQYIVVYLTIFAILGWIGGSATYRLLYWAMPAVLILVGLALQNMTELLNRNWLFIFLCSVSILISQRVFWLHPDYPGGESRPWVFMTPLCSAPNLLDTIGMGELRVRFLATASYIAVAVLLLVVLSMTSRRRLHKT